jgi:redox-sensing transcriptional repressor
LRLLASPCRTWRDRFCPVADLDSPSQPLASECFRSACWRPSAHLEWHGAELRPQIPSDLCDLPFMSMGNRNHVPPVPKDVPKAVVSRLSLYLRELQQLLRSGRATVSSNQLGQLLGFTDAQVRKDLTHFGQFGHPGIGYRCEELAAAIRRILGTDRVWTVGLVGVGNLGRALLGYKGFAAKGFSIVAAFDIDARKTNATVDGIQVYGLDRLREVVQRHRIQLAMLTVPAAAAQGVADTVAAAGVTGIVNFAPVTLSVPDEISLVGVDLATELEQISFSVANRLTSR